MTPEGQRWMTLRGQRRMTPEAIGEDAAGYR
jgi:hypothetical protein